MAKRSNGEGTIYRRDDGRWCCRVSAGISSDGRPKYKWFYGKTQYEVKQKLAEYLRDIDDGIAGKDTPFETLAALWYREYKDEVTPQTYEGYKYTLRILLSHFGDMRLGGIRALEIERFLRERRDAGASRSQLSKLRGMLFQIFNFAVANKLIRDNPVAAAKKTRLRDVNTRCGKDSFTIEEVELLMRDLAIDKIGVSIRVMLATGLRSQELLALQPEHIEEDGSMIYVRQAVKVIRGTASIGPPKSKDGVRDVPVPAAVRPYARALRGFGSVFIWCGRLPGTVANPTTFRTAYSRALEKVDGVRKLSPHCCRHTYISHLQASGVDVETIRVLAGHADIEMTEHYMHIQKESMQCAADKINQLFKIS